MVRLVSARGSQLHPKSVNAQDVSAQLRMKKARLKKELDDIDTDKTIGISVQAQNNSLQDLYGWIVGPEDTPYEGGRFQVEILIGDDYPFAPPKIRFISKVWHPNINPTNGNIDLEILKDDQWQPALTIKSTLISLQELLAKPEPCSDDNPQNGCEVVVSQFFLDHALYVNTAIQWTLDYANPSTTDEKMARLMEMGFENLDEVAAAISSSGGDETKALEKLLDNASVKQLPSQKRRLEDESERPSEGSPVGAAVTKKQRSSSS